jgi:hypothetical protein
MNKKTEGNTPIPTPEQTEIANLRNALAEEQIKTEALSRRCIRLGDALEAAIRAEDIRAEKAMFDAVNENSDKRKAAAIARKHRSIRRRKASDACMRNSFAMALASMIAFVAVIFSTAGIINPTLGIAIVGFCLIAFGWTLSACIHLLRMVEE